MDAMSFPPAYYEILIKGHLGPESAIWFEGMSITVNEESAPPQTIICGRVRDQADMYGLISRARDLGLTLISVRAIDAGPVDQDI